MTTRLVRKLERLVPLSPPERKAVESLTREGLRRLSGRDHIVRAGECPATATAVLDGLACRYRVLEDGRRQIVGFLLPGDLSSAHLSILCPADHSIKALSPMTVADIPNGELAAAAERWLGIGRALAWAALAEETTAREWIVSLGLRDATERISHLLCELVLRLRAVGLGEGEAFALPLTQRELADAVGISTVHVNRTLMELRRQGLVTLRGRTLAIHDLERLQGIALFDPRYLHLDGERAAAGLGAAAPGRDATAASRDRIGSGR